MSWPNGGDPFYLANPGDNNARRAYYDVQATPTMRCDGLINIYDPTNAYYIISAIQSRLSVPSQVWLQISAQAGFDSIHVSVAAVANQSLSNATIHIALLDHYSYLPNSPNGQPNHYHAMRQMGPTAYGQPFSAEPFDTVYYSAVFPSNVDWLADTLDVACFVQDNSGSKEVYQSACGTISISFPNLVLAGYSVSDSGGNNDGRVDPGEIGRLMATLVDLPIFSGAQTVTGALSTMDSLITITVPQTSFPDVEPGDSTTSVSPFLFTVDPTLQPHPVTFTLTITAQPGNFTAAYSFSFMVGRPGLLLVNDDPNGSYQSFYENALDSLGRVHDSWNQHQSGAVPEDELLRYSKVIWYSGSDTAEVLDSLEQQKIQAYLDSGGKLLLSSQNAGDVLGGTTFYQNVLHAQHLQDHVFGILMSGVPGDPVSNGTSICLVGGTGANDATSSSNLAPLEPAVGIYFYQSDTTFGALRWESGPSRLIYMAFALEAASGIYNTSPLRTILGSCLAWLDTPSGVAPDSRSAALPATLRISGVYPNPFNPSAVVEYQLPQPGLTDVSIFDLQGRLVDRIVHEWMAAGLHRAIWNGRGSPSGLYLIRVTGGGHEAIAKALLLK